MGSRRGSSPTSARSSPKGGQARDGPDPAPPDPARGAAVRSFYGVSLGHAGSLAKRLAVRHVPSRGCRGDVALRRYTGDMAYQELLTKSAKRLALVAHDNKKQELPEWARFNRSSSTGTSGAPPCASSGKSGTAWSSSPFCRIDGERAVGLRRCGSAGRWRRKASKLDTSVPIVARGDPKAGWLVSDDAGLAAATDSSRTMRYRADVSDVSHRTGLLAGTRRHGQEPRKSRTLRTSASRNNPRHSAIGHAGPSERARFACSTTARSRRNRRLSPGHKLERERAANPQRGRTSAGIMISFRWEFQGVAIPSAQIPMQTRGLQRSKNLDAQAPRPEDPHGEARAGRDGPGNLGDEYGV